jgi:peptide/nickel transport system substrate-binding protein
VLWGYNDDVPGYAHDPEKARALLREAGYPDGFDTTLWVMMNPRPYLLAPEKVAEAILADLAEVGIRAKLVTYDWGTYLDKTDHGEHDMAILGWSGDNGDPDNFLYILLDKDATRIPATNIAFFENDALHDLLVRAKETTDWSERERLYREAQVVVHDQAPWVPIAHTQQVMIFRSSVRGFVLHPTTKTDFKHTWIE